MRGSASRHARRRAIRAIPSQTAVWSQRDFNYDGVTNVFDLVGINTAGAYGQGSYLPTASAAASAAAVNGNPSGGPSLDLHPGLP